MQTIPNIISIAKISQYLAANAIAKAGLFGGGKDRLLPQKLYNIRKSVSFFYDLDPDDDNLVKTANYLYALCAPYLLEAQVILGLGNAGVVAGGGGTSTSVQSPIRITSDNFDSATEWAGQNDVNVPIVSSYTLQVFWNDVQRFLTPNVEWVRTATGFEILVDGFNATTNDYVLYVYISV